MTFPMSSISGGRTPVIKISAIIFWNLTGGTCNLPKSECRWYGTETECGGSGTRTQQQFSCYIPSNLALFTPYQMWVEAANQLGSATSDIVTLDILDVGRSRLKLFSKALPRSFSFLPSVVDHTRLRGTKCVSRLFPPVFF